MSLSKTLRMTAMAVAVGSAMAATPALAGDVSASATVANMYLWRGIDLGDGSAAVSGDLVYSVGSAYAGVWVSSGDDALGQEYDYFVGYGAEMGDFSADISLWNYNYSDGGLFNKTGGFDVSDDTTGELSEVILTLGYGPVSFSYYDNIAGASGYSYMTLSGTAGKFSATVGQHDFNADAGNSDDMTHVDVSYAFNDNLSFTASKVVGQDCDKDDDPALCAGAVDEDLKFVVSYSLPITM